MITSLLSRWRIILPLIIISVMSLSILYYKTRYERTVHELGVFKAELLASQKAGELLEKASKAQLNSVMVEHERQLKQAKLEREKVTNNLKGSINEIRDSLTIANNAIKLRNESSNNTMRQVSADTEGFTEAERNCNAYLETVIDACKVTDIDYEALYNAWQRQCDLGLCE